MEIETHLLAISDKKHNNVLAESSMKYIYEKFREYVYNLVFHKIHFKLQKEDTALTVMSNVFLHVWNNPLDWEFDSKKHLTQEGGFKSYLSVVTKYKFLEELRATKDKREYEANLINDSDSEWKWSLLDEELDTLDKELGKRINLVDQLIGEFSQKKQDIIRMYFLLYTDGKNMKREDIVLMEDMFETTWQNIRQIISRVKREIKKGIRSQTFQ